MSDEKLPEGWTMGIGSIASSKCMIIELSKTADDAEMNTNMRNECDIVIPESLAVALLRRAGWTVTRNGGAK